MDVNVIGCLDVDIGCLDVDATVDATKVGSLDVDAIGKGVDAAIGLDEGILIGSGGSILVDGARIIVDSVVGSVAGSVVGVGLVVGNISRSINEVLNSSSYGPPVSPGPRGPPPMSISSVPRAIISRCCRSSSKFGCCSNCLDSRALVFLGEVYNE